MVKIEKQSYGFYITFQGRVTHEEMQAWVAESRELLDQNSGKFCILTDLVDCESLPGEAEEIMTQVHELFMNNGLHRAAVVIDKLEMDIQPRVKNSCIDSGIYESCRYIDIKTTPNWKKRAVDWIRKGTEPF